MVRKNNRPYKYNSKSRLTSTSSFPFNSSSVKKLNESKKNLDNTLTKFRLDDDTINNKDILDDTFLEGRTEKKNTKKKNKKKINISITFWKKVCLITSIVCASILAILIMINSIKQWTTPENKEKVVIEKKKNIDDNYLFVGDYYTNNFLFQNFGLDYHYVKSSSYNLTTRAVLNSMKKMIYDFNPSVVFLELGNIDLKEGISEEEYLNNMGAIIDLIKMNRPNATICVESLYLTETIDVVQVNDKLKELCNDKDVYYVDVYNLLNKREYYNDDYSLSELGYQELYKKIKSIVG